VHRASQRKTLSKSWSPRTPRQEAVAPSPCHRVHSSACRRDEAPRHRRRSSVLLLPWSALLRNRCATVPKPKARIQLSIPCSIVPADASAVSNETARRGTKFHVHLCLQWQCGMAQLLYCIAR